MDGVGEGNAKRKRVVEKYHAISAGSRCVDAILQYTNALAMIQDESRIKKLGEKAADAMRDFEILIDHMS